MQYLLSKYRVTGQSTFRLSSRRTIYAKILYYVLSIVFLSPFIMICILANLVGNHRRRFRPSFLETDMHCIEMARTSFIFSVFSCLFGVTLLKFKFFSQTGLSSFDKNVLQER